MLMLPIYSLFIALNILFLNMVLFACGSNELAKSLGQKKSIHSERNQNNAESQNSKVVQPFLADQVFDCRGALPLYNLEPSEWKNSGWWQDAATAPEHFAADAITNGTFSPKLSANFKIALGTKRTNPENEKVEVFIDSCTKGTIKFLKELQTDSKGNVEMEIAPTELPGFGIFRIHFRLAAHGSWVFADLHYFPKQTRFAVFDIDETLTTGDTEFIKQMVVELFGPILQKIYVPTARLGASKVTNFRNQQGLPIIYLSGRPHFVSGFTRDWLASGSFAPGYLRHAPSIAEVVPTKDGVGSWKLAELKALLAWGYRIDFAYGNASTDVYAYNAAGISNESTFIVGKKSKSFGKNGLGEDFLEHLKEIGATQAE
jgi:hypothetical protein